MRSRCIAIFFLVFCGVAAAGDSTSSDDALMTAARAAIQSEITTEELQTSLASGLWDGDGSAVAISILRGRSSIVFVFLKREDGSFLAVDVSGVELGNCGALGRRRSEYERCETVPIKWFPREEGRFRVLMRTRAWKDGQRYTATEPLLIRQDGKVMWR
jgi:hypothetical protein